MPNESLPTLLRDLIARARNKPLEMNLSQIASVCDVQYDRLWRFTNAAEPSDKLLLDEAERLRSVLTKLIASV